MIDSIRRCSSADSENMREKITKIYFRQGAAIYIFLYTSANSVSTMLIYHFELQILPKVSKIAGIIAQTLKNGFPVKTFRKRSEFADFSEINRAKTSTGARVAEHF